MADEKSIANHSKFKRLLDLSHKTIHQLIEKLESLLKHTHHAKESLKSLHTVIAHYTDLEMKIMKASSKEQLNPFNIESLITHAEALHKKLIEKTLESVYGDEQIQNIKHQAKSISKTLITLNQSLVKPHEVGTPVNFFVQPGVNSLTISTPSPQNKRKHG